MIISKRMRWTGHVACIGEEKSAYEDLIGKPDGLKSLRRPKPRWEDKY
jgi:hypothetical protein